MVTLKKTKLPNGSIYPPLSHFVVFFDSQQDEYRYVKCVGIPSVAVTRNIIQSTKGERNNDDH